MSEWVVTAGEAGAKLGNFIRDKLSGARSARQVKRELEENRCVVNGAIERFASRVLTEGDRIHFDDAQPITTAETRWETLYADDDIVICNKPAGTVVDSPETHQQLCQEYGPIILVHRLDRDTTGAFLLARNEAAAKALESQFKQRTIDKVYLALVDGLVAESQGEIKNSLGKVHVYDGQAIWGEVPRGQGPLAHTVWRVIGRGQRATLVACQPKTGRTHQLRAHLKGLGHPILGDYQYARRFSCDYKPTRCLLHASEITFHHPRTGTKRRVRVPLPADFAAALAAVHIHVK
jgi:RluA family pseudouridine synthase